MLKEDFKQGLIRKNKQEASKDTIKIKQSTIIEQDEDSKNISNRKKHHRSEITYILKTLNFLVGIAYVAFAAYCYMYGNTQKDLNKGVFVRYVLPAYVGLSGLIILLIECRVGFMVRNLRFFYNYFGRGFFNVYAGLMPLMLINDWSNMDTFEIITIVAASIMCVVGLLYMSLKCFCCEKEGEQVQKSIKANKKEKQLIVNQ